MLRIISLGLGVQSTALYLMASMGELPRADYAIFADTGKESTATYNYLEFLQEWKAKNDGIDIAVCRDRYLFEDLLEAAKPGRFGSIPAFTKGEDGSIGMLRRQCTWEYKIAVVDNHIRDHIYRLPKGSRRPKTAIWHCITLDEVERMSIPQESWKINSCPCLGYCVDQRGQTGKLDWAKPMSRHAVTGWYEVKGLPVPPKSACVFCPYQSDRSWARRKKEAPSDFAAAVLADEAIRNSTAKGVRNPIFLHRSCIPLSEVAFDEAQEEEWGECSGTCHV